MISARWIAEQARGAGIVGLVPQADPRGFFVESVELTIAGQTLALGDADRPVWLGSQGEEIAGVEMPGLEDVLLGRDFMTQHGLFLVIDGASETLSLLLPADARNRDLRDQICSLLDADH